MGNIISISGVDGSGKTSIIEELIKDIESRGIQTQYVWLRYNHYLTKGLLAFCRLAGYTKYHHYENSRVGYHEFYRSKIISWLFIGLTFVDTLFATIIKVYIPAIFMKKTIVCDRWMLDIMVDLEVDTKISFYHGTLLNSLFKFLIPNAAKCFLIKREFESVRKERDESINDNNFPKRHDLYIKHSTDASFINVNNNGTIEESVNQIIDKLNI